MRIGGGPTRSLSDSAASLAGWLASLPAQVRTWRARQRISPGWTAVVAGLAAIMALPLATIVVLSLTRTRQRLAAPDAHRAAGRARRHGAAAARRRRALTLVFGTGTAWLITMYRFPGPRPCSTACWCCRWPCRPTSSPTATWSCSTSPGPCSARCARCSAGTRCRDYWFPEVRTLPGAILVLSAVLYPYVYLSARASFVQQSVCVLEVARTLGRTSAGTFWSVALPLARPALAAGVALALMECLNDLGAVQYLGVHDADGQHLHHLAAALEPRRRGADRAGRAAVRAGAAGGRAGRARRQPLPPHHRPLSLDPVLRSGGLARLRRHGLLLPAGAGRLRGAVRRAARAGVGARVGRLARRLLARGAQQRRRRRGGGRGDGADRPAAWPTRGAWRPTSSCARPCGRRASATPCPAPCWRSAC